MASEITLDGRLAYSDGDNVIQSLAVAGLVASVASKIIARHTQSIGTSESALNLGAVSSPGWLLVVNRDITNYVELRVATAGAKFAKLLAGEFCLLRLGSGAQVPYAIANTSACKIEVLLLST